MDSLLVEQSNKGGNCIMSNIELDVARLKHQIKNFKDAAYRNRQNIDTFEVFEDDGNTVNPQLPDFKKFNKSLNLNDFWIGRDKYIWLSFEYTVPSEFLNKELVGVFDFGKTGAGNASAFESLLYINKEIYQAVDSNHKEVFLGSFEKQETINFTFRLWSGLEGGGEKIIQYHQLKTAFISIFERVSDKYAYLLQNCLEAVTLLNDSNLIKYKIYKAIIASYKKVDWTNKNDDEFYTSVDCAYRSLLEALKLIPRNNDVEVGLVGHTHIDLAWLWRYRHTREKGVRSFSTVNRFMDMYDDYKFMHTSPQLYQSIKEDSPELYEKIKGRIKSGKWEPSGAMWVEADCNIPNGESLIRQVYYGKKFFKEEFGVESNYLWLPDVFGYSWALPQILVKSNVDTFVTTKISWNDTNRMPHDTFLWKGIDGTPILTHFISTPEKGLTFATYNGNTDPYAIEGVWGKYKDKLLNNDMLICYGYGDGGGGPSRDMIENIEAIKNIPGLPKVRFTTVEPYLKKLHQSVKDNDEYLSVWSNELYFEFHRGTYTSQAKIKKSNRLLEQLYRDTEIMCSISSILSDDEYPKMNIEKGWKLILKNQFHDIIPGSSIEEVYADSEVDHNEAFRIAMESKETAISKIFEKSEDNYSVINNTGRKRCGIVNVGGNYCYTEIEPFSIGIVKSVDESTESISYDSSVVDSPYYKIIFNEKGQLISIFDKEIDSEILSGVGNVFEIFEDRPKEYDAWELDRSFEQKGCIIDRLTSSELGESNDNFISIKQTYEYNRTTIYQNIIVYTKIKRIDFKTKILWYEKSKLLKVAFPVDVHSLNARYEIQNGSIERPTHRSTSWDEAKFEVLGHSWADLSDENLGVSIINNCKYGYDIHDNVMRLTLLKSAEFPDLNADEGIQEFTYSIYSHGERWNDSQLLDLAFDLNNPLEVIQGKCKFKLSDVLDFADCDVIIDTIKACDDGEGYLIRFHEDKGRKSKYSIKLGDRFDSWCRSNLLETPIENFKKVRIIEGVMKPFEIVSLIVK
jgi:alpha-mannosidase